MLVAVTRALATRPPVESLTVPARFAVMTCAVTRHAVHARRIRTHLNSVFIGAFLFSVHGCCLLGREPQILLQHLPGFHGGFLATPHECLAVPTAGAHFVGACRNMREKITAVRIR